MRGLADAGAAGDDQHFVRRRLADGVALGRGQFQPHLLLDPAERRFDVDRRQRMAPSRSCRRDRATPSSARNSGFRYSHGSAAVAGLSRTSSPSARACSTAPVDYRCPSICVRAVVRSMTPASG